MKARKTVPTRVHSVGDLLGRLWYRRPAGFVHGHLFASSRNEVLRRPDHVLVPEGGVSCSIGEW